MATRTRIIGPISAYAIAVSKGYTGTEEEFAQEIANASTNAATAEAAAEQVQELVNDLPSSFTALLEELDDTQKMVSSLYIPDVPIAAGEYKVKDGYLYKCNTAVSAESNTSWDAVSQYFDHVNVGGELVVLEDAVRRAWSDEIKLTLLSCMRNVAWSNQNGQDYYDALYAALNPPEDLSYISAVYTQSGTIYTTDSLQSLRSGLVVTAHYLGGRSSRIYGYMLSGTLVEGTSTITVEYGGKTTTFSVTVSVDVGLVYRLSQPTIFHGTGSEVINTNVVLLDSNHDFSVLLSLTPDAPTEIEMPFYAGGATSRVVFQYSVASSVWFVAAPLTDNDKRFDVTNIVPRKENRIVLRRKVGTWVEVYVLGGDGTLVTGGPVAYGDIVSDEPIRLGGYRENNNNYCYKGTMSICKVYSRYLSNDEVNSFLYGGG